jgi:hypothetical protein
MPILAFPGESVKPLPEEPVEHESRLEDANLASFAVTIARDVLSFSTCQMEQSDPPFHLVELNAIIGVTYQSAVHELDWDDSQAVRAQFRIN